MPGVGVLDPRTLGSRLFAWYRPEVFAGAAPDSTPSTWDDSSDNARHLTVANTPLVRKGVSGLNGLPVMEFDGVNERYVRAIAGTLPKPLTVLAVVKNSVADDGLLHRAVDHNSFQSGVGLNWLGTNTWIGIDSNGSVSTTIPGDVGVWHVISAMLMPATGATIASLDGIRNRATGAVPALSNLDISIGGSTGATEFWNGQIAEAMFIYDQMEVVQLREWEHSLARKFNLTSQYKLND